MQAWPVPILTMAVYFSAFKNKQTKKPYILSILNDFQITQNFDQYKFYFYTCFIYISKNKILIDLISNRLMHANPQYTDITMGINIIAVGYTYAYYAALFKNKKQKQQHMTDKRK